jgi:hypothetical protein
MSSTQETKFWLEDLKSLFSDLSLIPRADQSINEQLNSMTRGVISLTLIQYASGFGYWWATLAVGLVVIIVVKYYVLKDDNNSSEKEETKYYSLFSSDNNREPSSAPEMSGSTQLSDLSSVLMYETGNSGFERTSSEKDSFQPKLFDRGNNTPFSSKYSFNANPYAVIVGEDSIYNSSNNPIDGLKFNPSYITAENESRGITYGAIADRYNKRPLRSGIQPK